MSQERKPKVLISAYACEPDKGSEQGVGWNWSKQIAKFAETWVITRANNREVIGKELRNNPDPNLHFIYYDVPRWLSFWKKRTRGLYLYYLLWQIGAYRIAIKLNKQQKFDIVHHLTFGNLWLPTFMSFLPVPFIWGPIGGGEQVPKVFRQDYDIKARLKEIMRDVIVSSLKFNLLFLYTSRKARLIIAKTSDTAKRIPDQSQNKVIVTTDVAIDPKVFKKKDNNNSELKIIAVGRLDPWRGFDLLIRALSSIAKANNKFKLFILGEGSDRKRLQLICKNEHLKNRVVFTGQVDREQYLEYMARSSIFVNPCLKEGGVTVLFDALTFGLPVICMDVAGASEIIDETCGIKIQPISPEQTVRDLAESLLTLVRNPELREKMGERGKERVKELFIWDKKGEMIKEYYAEIISNF